MKSFNFYSLFGFFIFPLIVLNGDWGASFLVKEVLQQQQLLFPFFFLTLIASGNEFLGGFILITQVATGVLEQALEKGLKIIALFAFIVATIVVMYGGYQIRSGNADAGKMSILGGLVIGLAIIIVTTIFEIAGLPVLKIK